MKWRTWVAAVTIFATLAGVAYSVQAFALFGFRWPNGTITMHVKMGPGSGRLIDGRTSWDQVIIDALNEWNNTVLKAIPIRFAFVRNSSRPIGHPNGFNNVVFRRTVFGTAWQSGVLGRALIQTNGAGLANEASIVLNSNVNWNSYRGARRAGVNDARRVALHEIGHLLGTTHPDQAGQNQTAIMNSRVSDIDKLRIDDINGVYRAHGVPICRVRRVSVGATRNGNLTNADCIAPHRPGTPRADLYSFRGTRGQRVVITMNRQGLSDPFLVLLGTTGGVLTQNNNGGAGRDARIVRTLTRTGTYIIEATAASNADRGTYALRLTK